MRLAQALKYSDMRMQACVRGRKKRLVQCQQLCEEESRGRMEEFARAL